MLCHSKKAAHSFSFLREDLEQQQNLSSEYFQFSVQGIHPRESPSSQANAARPREPLGAGRRAQPPQARLLCAEGGTAASRMSKSLVLQLCTTVRRLWMHTEDLETEEGGQNAGPQMLWT